MQAIAVALAVLGAALFAGAAVLQHREVADLYGEPDPRERVMSLRRLSRIARRPGWLAGFGLAAGGTIVHAVALALAPLRLVSRSVCSRYPWPCSSPRSACGARPAATCCWASP